MTLPPPGRRAAAALPCAGTRGEGSCGSGRWDPAAAPRVAEPPLPGRWLRSTPAPAPPPGTGALGLRRHRSILSALLSLSVRRLWGLLCRELAVCRALPGSRQRGRSLCERELCSPPVMDGDRVEIDGGIMEGGGQILRVSTALSCLLGLPLRVRRIRAGRSQPGLRPQHLSGLEIIRDLCEGKLEGGEIGSTEITFTPGKIKGGTHIADTKTAGSVCLLMQVAMPCVLFAASPSELHLKGGTNAEMAPQIDYTVMVFKPIIEKFNFTFNCDIKKRGYYPQGGGEVVVQMSPVKELSPINLTERGTVTKIYGRAFVAGALPIKLAKDMSAAAVRCIRKEIRDLYINIQPVREPDDQAFGTGSGIIIVAETSTGCLLAGSSLGKRGKNSDKVGIEAAEILLRNLKHGGTVDDSLQDQLIIFMALAKGVSRVKSGPITLHTQTAIHFAEQLTKAKFTVTKSEEEDPNKDTYIIECQGMGMINPNL